MSAHLRAGPFRALKMRSLRQEAVSGTECQTLRQVAAAAEPGVQKKEADLFSRPPSSLSEKKSNEIGKHGCSYYCKNTAYHD